jgi:hypothetical protein
MEIMDTLTDVDVAIHFRMATDGRVNKHNAHPFKLKNQSWLMHNGILSAYRTSKDDVKSDTRNFVETFCNPLIKKHGSVPKTALEQEIFGSTICLMNKDGSINRYGSGWVKYSGSFYSNEYAWDSPTYSAAYSSKVQSNLVSTRRPDYIFDDVDRGFQDESILAEAMLGLLEQCTDILPYTDPSYVSYDDIWLQDQIGLEAISGQEFIEYCSAETLLLMYTWAVSQGHITA